MNVVKCKKLADTDRAFFVDKGQGLIKEDKKIKTSFQTTQETFPCPVLQHYPGEQFTWLSLVKQHSEPRTSVF